MGTAPDFCRECIDIHRVAPMTWRYFRAFVISHAPTERLGR
jgi:hypothetical protein